MMDKGNVLLILWIGALCVTIGADKDKPWKPGMERFFRALTQEVDHHLKQSLRHSFSNQVSTEASSNLPYTEAEYSKGLQMDIQNFFDTLKKAVKRHTDKKSSGFSASVKGYKTSHVTQTTEGYPATRSTTEGYPKATRSTTEGYPKATRSTTEGYPKATRSTTEGYPKATRSTTEGYPKATRSTTEGYPKATPSTTEGYPKATPSTTEGYTKATLSTTEAYVKGHHGTGDCYEKSDHATAEGYGEEHDATKSGYGKEHDATTEGYGKENLPKGCVKDPPPTVYHGCPMQVGSLKGIPGVHFPNYTDIPITSFTCYDKEFLPGFYADLETGCQAFHVCWSNRRESFLCPCGTTFNQALLACDYWYSTNCSLTPHYYSKNAETSQYEELDLKSKTLSSMINNLLQKGDYASIPTGPSQATSTPDAVLSFISQFLPVKAKITVYPETGEKRAKVVASTSIGTGKVSDIQKGKPTETLTPLHVQSHSQSSSKPEIWKDSEKADAYRKAVEVFLAKLSVAVKLIIKEIVDIADKNATAKSLPPVPGKHTPVTGKPKLPTDHDFRGYEDTKVLLNRIVESLVGWFRKETKSKDAVQKVPEPVKKDAVQKVPEPVKKDAVQKVPEPVKKVPEPVKHRPLTQLNPKFIIKPVVIQKDVLKHKEPVSYHTKRVTIKHPKMSVPKSGQTIGLNIMPLTKQKLIGNYIRLLKIKST